MTNKITKSLPTTAKTHITNLYTLREYKRQLKEDTEQRKQKMITSAKSLFTFKTIKDTIVSKLPGMGGGDIKKKVPTIVGSVVKSAVHLYLSRYRRSRGIQFIFTKLWTLFAEKTADRFLPNLQHTITGLFKRKR